MDLLAAFGRLNALAGQHLPDQLIPPARLRRMRQAINPRRPQGTDWPTFAEPEAVDEFLHGCLVSSIVALGPKRMRLIERPIVEDHIMHRARRDIDAARHPGLARRLKKLQ